MQGGDAKSATGAQSPRHMFAPVMASCIVSNVGWHILYFNRFLIFMKIFQQFKV